MTFCQAQTAGGSRCGRDSTDQSYFWYFDPHQRVNRTFHLCQDHSNSIINVLIQKETGISHLIDKLYTEIEKLRILKNKGANFTEQRQAAKNAKENGVPPPTFKSVMKIDNEIQELFRKIKVYKELKNKERNHTCRYDKCRYFLKEPNEKQDQVGNSYGHADFHSGHGYRREVILFHTECGLSWLISVMLLLDKELKYVRPQLTKQGVLFS